VAAYGENLMATHNHQQFIRTLAAHPDEWLYTSDIVEAMGLPASSLRGMLGAFGRRANHRYGGHKPWDEEWDPAAYEARYRMPGWIARIIQSL
jgi:hypothetical protein